MKFEETALQRDWEISKEQSCVDVADDDATPSDAALGALLEDAEPSDADAERRVRRLGSRLARLDALNVAGMLAAATESGGAGAALAERLGDGLGAGAALAARLRRYDALARAAPAAPHARSDAARADTNARRLLAELAALFAWLDAAPLRELDALAEVSLAAPEGRARALAAAEALRAALRAEAAAPAALRRLAAVRERLRRLARAKDQLAAALARHLNNALIHLGNEAGEARASRHHAELLPYAPFMRWLKDMDDKAFEGLARVYTGTWARRHERELRAACDAARAALAQAPPDRADEPLDAVLSLVESMCNAEQDFCTQFFFLDIDVKGEAGEAEAERGEARRAGAETRRFMCELFPALESELVALVAHVERHDPYGAMRALACVGRRVLGAAEGGAGGGAGAGGEARWARAALAGVAVAAKRGADRCVADRLAALPDAVKQAAKKPKCGLLSFLQELEELSGACERIFVSSGRRADLDRWYVSLASAMLQAVQHAEHPRTPRAVLHMENYHRLHAVLSALRVPALEALRRECRHTHTHTHTQTHTLRVTENYHRLHAVLSALRVPALEALRRECRHTHTHTHTQTHTLRVTENYHRLHAVLSALRVPALEALRRECRTRYSDALRAYVTQYFGRPLEKLTQFFEGVSEAVAQGVREDEVCYRAAFSKHELRRVLAMYPAHEVRKSLHRLYRTVEKHLSEEGGLLQVVWRAMQEEFIAQHVALQARIAACYPAAGLALPLTTQHILDAFSDIAREH
ncbi:exocyst complex component 1 isoform X3 [Helicoverpa zea]|uniref:exocyst complex component 1 isoform X3 n=1 Tax=Helicoverpa zea TaxID=7113 RepID=UPI001F5850BE|nr:exocyst complex component 1 isoform X3 [Helicoverpa zea]